MTTGYTPEGYALAMTYDAQNRMKAAQCNDGASHLYQYSYSGNSLLSELIKDSEKRHLGSGLHITQEGLRVYGRVSSRRASNFIRRGELNMERRLKRLSFALFFLTILAFISSLASAEVITYDYDNAGQVKKVIYANGATVAATNTLRTDFSKCQEGIKFYL